MSVTKKRAVKSRSKRTLSTAHAATRTQEKLPIPAEDAPAKEGSSVNDPYGFRKGSDISVVLAELLKGGESKHHVATRISEVFEGRQTKGGNPKPVSTVMNQVENLMRARGFQVESSWKLVPPANGIIAKPPRARKARARKPVQKAAGNTNNAATKMAKANGPSSLQKPSQPRVKPKPRRRSQ